MSVGLINARALTPREPEAAATSAAAAPTQRFDLRYPAAFAALSLLKHFSGFVRL